MEASCRVWTQVGQATPTNAPIHIEVRFEMGGGTTSITSATTKVTRTISIEGLVEEDNGCFGKK